MDIVYGLGYGGLDGEAPKIDTLDLFGDGKGWVLLSCDFKEG